MRIGKLGITIGQSHYVNNPKFSITRVKYFGSKGGEFIIQSFGYFINLSWLGSIYKLSTDI